MVTNKNKTVTMKQQTILKQILDDINNIEWSTNTVKSKAIKFISNFINVSVFKYKSLDEAQHLSQQYWKYVIPGKTDHLKEIKSKLISNTILNEFAGLYNKDKRIKSYKLNYKYINNNFNYINIVDPFSNKLKIKELQEVENNTKNVIKNINIVKGSTVCEKGSIVQDMLNTIEIIKGSTVCEKGSIVSVKLNDIDYTYKMDNAIKFSEENNYTLIKYGDKKSKYYFVRNLEEWKKFKAINLVMCYQKQLFDIENNIIFVNRNETNNRLDSNLTTLKSELWEFLRLDNEKLIEIDIINSQFAFLANIMQVDDLFYELATTGKLYEYIAKQLNITRKEAKNKMFRVAFDKVKTEQDDIRNLFPLTMSNVDLYKKENGYKLFSNLLQITESNMMIDNVLYELQKEFDVVSVHDSIRCKESDYDKVLNKIQEIFNRTNFKCTLKQKTTKTNVNMSKHTNNIKEESVSNEELFDYWYIEYPYSHLKGKGLEILVKNKKMLKREFMEQIKILKGSKLLNHMNNKVNDLIKQK